MFFKKRKPPMEEKEEKITPSFEIIQFKKVDGIKKGKDNFQSTPFISPIFGLNVLDETVVPNIGDGFGDVTKRYDAFREVKKIDEEEIIRTRGTKYYEFTNIVSHETRQKIFGQDVKVVKGKKLEKKPTYEPKVEVPFSLGRQKENTKQPAKLAPMDDHFRPVRSFEDFKSITVESDAFSFEETKEKHVVDVPFFKEEPVIQTYEREIPKFVTEKVKPVVSEPAKPIKEERHSFFHKEKKTIKYELPSPSMFKKIPFNKEDKPDWIEEQIEAINSTFIEFDIEASVTGFTKGPTVTRYEITLERGVNVRRITNIQDNIKMNLAAKTIRIEAPIPGKPYVGLEVPNKKADIVAFGNVVDTPEFRNDASALKVALGLDIDANNIYIDIAKMPHGLIAGATNSGKSVCVNTLLVSLLLKNHPDDLKLILIDPKMVELMSYNDLPHLITPVITDAKIAASALKWAVEEMERRYLQFLDARVRDIKTFNQKVLEGHPDDKMPYMVIIIDELADLMMASSNDVEDAIQRLTQKARAAGIHLLVATQRPTTDVVKGTIKSNIPTRIAFKVASYVDSTTILDGAGAENLLGRGDMLLKEGELSIRIQGAYIPDDEIDKVTTFIRSQARPNYLFTHDALSTSLSKDDGGDDLFESVARFVVSEQTASINRIQKEFNIGFNRAQRLVELLESSGIVSDGQGTKAREVLVTPYELETILGK